MTEAFVYDAIRTPRGRGKNTGSLHATKPISLVVGLLEELRKRNPNLDPARVEDVILGCVSPIGEQGADIARTAALAAGYETSGPGFQLNRFCASGLEASTSAPRRSAPAGRTSSSPAASSRCRACRWVRTAARGRWTRRPRTTPASSPRASAPT